MEPGTDFGLVEGRLLGKSGPLGRERKRDGGKNAEQNCGVAVVCFIPHIQVKISNSQPFSWTRSGRGMSGGKTGASRGGSWQSRSGETRDGFAAWTPTLRRAPETSPGEIPPAWNTHV